MIAIYTCWIIFKHMKKSTNSKIKNYFINVQMRNPLSRLDNANNNIQLIHQEVLYHCLIEQAHQNMDHSMTIVLMIKSDEFGPVIANRLTFWLYRLYLCGSIDGYTWRNRRNLFFWSDKFLIRDKQLLAILHHIVL